MPAPENKNNHMHKVPPDLMDREGPDIRERIKMRVIAESVLNHALSGIEEAERGVRSSGSRIRRPHFTLAKGGVQA
jgi:hypothetical protein